MVQNLARIFGFFYVRKLSSKFKIVVGPILKVPSRAGNNGRETI
jgi:hypothetical protein